MDSMEKEFHKNASTVIEEFIKLQSKRYFDNLTNVFNEQQKNEQLEKLKDELKSMDKRMDTILSLANTIALKRADIAMDVLNGNFIDMDNDIDEVDMLKVMIKAGLDYMNLRHLRI